MKHTVTVAETAGFCFGVDRSVNLALKMLENGPGFSFGQPIHNADAVGMLEKKGLTVIEDADSLSSGDRVLIRAHGVSRSVFERIEASGAVITDGTCPKVKAIHRIVEQASQQGRTVLIIGNRAHPEVEGIAGRCGKAFVIQSPEEAEQFCDEHPELLDSQLSVVVQTTQTVKIFENCVKILKKGVQIFYYLLQYVLLRPRVRRKLPHLLPKVMRCW